MIGRERWSVRVMPYQLPNNDEKNTGIGQHTHLQIPSRLPLPNTWRVSLSFDKVAVCVSARKIKRYTAGRPCCWKFFCFAFVFVGL